MNRGNTVRLVIGLIVVVAFVITVVFYSQTNHKVPASVLTKYTELEKQYKSSLGAGINYCKKGSEVIYTAYGSGGFTGVTFYYDEEGNELGSSYFTDEYNPDNPLPEPPVNLEEYECIVIKESGQFAQDKVWLEMTPVQCLGNPWEQDWFENHPRESYEDYPRGDTVLIEEAEVQIIKDYYKGQGITIYDVQSRNVIGSTCASCSCPDGYLLYLRVADEDVDEMISLGYRNRVFD